MDLLQSFSGAFVLLLVVAVAVVVCVIGWQLLKISRDARARARHTRAARESDEAIRVRLRERGFNENEITDALRHVTASSDDS